ncbi:MAG TPA: rhodanese-like domain-containing protein [Geminicoccaceae bacterium]|jgi:rhodanese-related sulfurtransferase|nr:rhodanese-like domain-containing protein [Geminicoccaceae bacterium]HZA67223.1 rhodanese-like domain-containing protein [Geminicoccaceae bacterium]
MVKRAAEMVAEANAAVGTLDVEEAKQLVGKDDVVFVDVREGAELAAQGKVPGAVHAPRSHLEFYADPSAPYHKPELSSGKRLVLYCGSGARSALAAKTLKDMGIGNVANMLGGFTAWQQGGGEIER